MFDFFRRIALATLKFDHKYVTDRLAFLQSICFSCVWYVVSHSTGTLNTVKINEMKKNKKKKS